MAQKIYSKQGLIAKLKIIFESDIFQLIPLTDEIKTIK